jgi:hypothetical protein
MNLTGWGNWMSVGVFDGRSAKAGTPKLGG